MDDRGGEARVRGRGDATEDLIPQVYEEMRALARRHLRRERGYNTLQTTALVHETFLRLRRRREPWEGRAHLLAAAAGEMRRILVERARERLAQKRGARPERVPLEDGLAMTREEHLTEMLAVDEALLSLAKQDPRLARVAELRLAGLSVGEIAQAVGVSQRTVKEDWRLARAWLARGLEGGRPGGPAR